MDPEIFYQALMLTILDVLTILIILSPFLILRFAIEMSLVMVRDIYCNMVVSGDVPGPRLTRAYELVTHVLNSHKLRKFNDKYRTDDHSLAMIRMIDDVPNIRFVGLKPHRWYAFWARKPEVWVQVPEGSKISDPDDLISYKFVNSESEVPKNIDNFSIKDLP